MGPNPAFDDPDAAATVAAAANYAGSPERATLLLAAYRAARQARGETTANRWLLIALGSDAASSETPDDLVASIVSIEGLSRLSRGAGGSEAPPAGNEWCASTSPPHVPRRSAYAGSTGAGSQGHDRRVRIVRVAVFSRRVGGVGCGQHDEHPNVRANVRLARERCSGPW